ncbi:MAG: DUF2075 domain-containing protein [Leptolyngbya sp. SIO4C1]|nr:DUF2075 domain-containing protein [Leptolyngbya sp. SIO4C1]
MVQTSPSDQLSLFGTETAEPWLWGGTIADFSAASDWLPQMRAAYYQRYQQQATKTQQQAWQDCATVLRSQLTQLIEDRAEAAQWLILFEYELPREGGRRPDVLVLAPGQIAVLEFKQKAAIAAADRDQAAAYARDLAEYHSVAQQCDVSAALVLTRREQSGEVQDAVVVLGPAEIAAYLGDLGQSKGAAQLSLEAWRAADYAPLPTVIQAARTIFENEPLPNIRRAHSARIPDVLDYLGQLVVQAQAQQERHLVLITGVPGAGKTLVGLQFVYQHPLRTDNQKQAVLLSGNGPLITVLQYALKSRAFVQPVRNFYLTYEVRQQKAPPEHIIVFDEAQRAWDAARMGEKYGIEQAAAGAVLNIASRVPDWCVVLGLIGEGQEIHVGEEEGTEQWNEAVASSAVDWQVHCSPQQATYFEPGLSLQPQPFLDLSLSLRSHLAKDLQRWVGYLLDSDFAAAAALRPQLSGFDMYVARDLETAKAYCRQRYAEQVDKRYGLMASSRARNLAKYGVANDYLATQRLKVGPWYIDPPDSLLSCCALTGVVTEFGCQGLELDFPIVCWGSDLTWQDGWTSSVRQKNVSNPLRLRLNSYRVLLTRGRDGFVVFVPPEPAMDSTYDSLAAAGLEPLSAEVD